MQYMITFPEALAIMQEEIRNIQYPEQPQRLYQPIAYLLHLKGKKIRPALTLLACNLYKENVEESLNAALAWEIFHNFTLMHDDVMDNADVRRGEPTVHKKWNENTAILSGDTMLVLAYKYIIQSPADKLRILLDLFSTTTTEIFEGQEYDMQFEDRLDVSEEEYLEMIRLKTAVMIGASLKTGAIIGEANRKDQDLLYDFGINLGIAFQIQDDILDVYGDPLIFGKKIGGDILCNKKTYLLVTALNTANKDKLAALYQCLHSSSRDKDKIEAVTSIYNDLSIKEKADAKKEEYYQKAIHALEKVSVSQERKSILKNLAEELMDRKS